MERRRVCVAASATSVVAVTLPELQGPLDFALKSKKIERKIDVGEILAPGSRSARMRSRSQN
jgi:hypothetical protein